MRMIYIGLFSLMLTGLAVAKTPPNIVVILSDDQGYADVSYSPFSPKEVSTPNIDKLASSGVVCTDGYASGYVCSPTRAGDTTSPTTTTTTSPTTTTNNNNKCYLLP